MVRHVPFNLANLKLRFALFRSPPVGNNSNKITTINDDTDNTTNNNNTIIINNNSTISNVPTSSCGPKIVYRGLLGENGWDRRRESMRNPEMRANMTGH